MVDELDCLHTESITCPYCGGHDDEPWEFGYNDGDSEIHRCGWCEKLFWVTTHCETTYTSSHICKIGKVDFEGVEESELSVVPRDRDWAAPRGRD